MGDFDKVVWAEGMLLSQQHLQQWDRRLEQRLRLYSQCVAPDLWGVISMDLDEAALQNGRFRLNACSVIFPEGQFAGFDAKDGHPLCCELADSDKERCDIFLCFPRCDSVSGLTGYRETDPLSGLRVEYRMTSDIYDTDREREIAFGCQNLVLLTGSSPRESFYSLKIAEVGREGNGGYRLIREFIPSLVHMSVVPFLMHLIQGQCELLEAKSRTLNDQNQPSIVDGAEFGRNQISQWLLLQLLNRSFITLQHIKDHSKSHPLALYQLLSGLTAELCAFTDTDRFRCSQIPIYRHDRLSSIFRDLDRLLVELLDEVMPVHAQPIRLRREDDTLYVADSIERGHFQKTSFFIAVSLVSDDPQWPSQFARQIKVGARSAIDDIVASALQGVKVIHRQRLPNRLPIKSGYEYFYLEPVGEFWERVKRDRALAIFLPYDFVDATLDLVTLQE